jgi:hypothetical protein
MRANNYTATLLIHEGLTGENILRPADLAALKAIVEAASHGYGTVSQVISSWKLCPDQASLGCSAIRSMRRTISPWSTASYKRPRLAGAPI